MHQVHVTAYINKPLPEVFTAVSDHRSFLTGGGLHCHLIKKGTPDKNGLGAIRTVRANKYTFTEEINAFEPNKSFDYQIIDVKPRLSLVHHNGWLEFSEENMQTRVDWHSHFTITTPIIGHLMGWFAKNKLEKVFTQRLHYLNKAQ